MEIINRSVSLAAATATELLTELADQQVTTGIDCLGKHLGVTLKNTGSNPLTGLTAYLTDDPTGAVWPIVTDVALAGGSLAAGASTRFTIDDHRARRVRFVGTSASGTSILVNVTMGERP